MTMTSPFSLASFTTASWAPPRYGYTARTPCAYRLLKASVAAATSSKLPVPT